jgi:hypothetical protein
MKSLRHSAATPRVIAGFERPDAGEARLGGG